MVKGKNNPGFTLIELMIVLALAGIMALIAAPNFQTYMTKNRLSGAARLVMTDLMYARGLAASENVTFKVDFTGNSYSIIRTRHERSEQIPQYTG